MNRIDTLRDARHDLGKYIAMQSRWAGEDELEETLTADLMHTHRGPAGSRTAVEVWESYRETLEGLEAAAPELARIEAAMARVVGFVDGNRRDLPGVRDAAVDIADALTSWYRRARKESE